MLMVVYKEKLALNLIFIIITSYQENDQQNVTCLKGHTCAVRFGRIYFT